MNEKWIEKRFAAPRHPAKSEAAKDSGEGFNFRFADVGNGKGDGLEPEGFCAEFASVAEEEKTAKEKFPAEKIEEGVPGEAGGKMVVIALHGIIFAH